MPTDHRAALAAIRTFPQLIAYLRDEMGWPISRESFDDEDDLFFEFTADELGIDPKSTAKIESIKRLRPLSPRQPWGIFFVKFAPRRLPVVALRRILSTVALKKRASANKADQAAWKANDLLFISNYGEDDERHITFAHFSQDSGKDDLPALKVLGWDNLDTPLHLDVVAKELTTSLAWPEDEHDADGWRERWSSAFTLRHREVITTSRQLSIRLAELARAIRDRIKTALAIETEHGRLTKLMKAFREALVHDLDAGGFADMYAQTIAYGLLSARIANPHSRTADDLSAHMRTNPFLKELMETFLHAGGRRGKAGGKGIDFDELGVGDVVELLDAANMEAVLHDFGDRNPQEDPVIHFYELFLKEYDAKKRMQRGVFYTPRPVVSYIVRSVDELLRTEFGLQDGLADTTTWGEMAERHEGLKIPDGVPPEQGFVQILDPACGTGTFLVEAIDVIHKTMREKWEREAGGPLLARVQQRWNEYVPKHLLPRLHGYELLMAPYAIAHLKIGLKLHETGYRFGSDQRARIFLTNALEPAQDFSGRFEFAIPALAHEAQAVNAIKQKQRFTVVIGNPPYSGLSANMTDDAQRLVDAYKVVDGEALNERKLWLQDDYVKFIRTAQTTIERAHVGVLGYITNHGYLDNPTFRGMRQSLMSSFPRIRVLDLHGNANKKERAPDGSEDKNVFEIRQGVAICLASCVTGTSFVRHADLWGTTEAKYEWLTSCIVGDTAFSSLMPDSPFYFFKPQNTDCRAEYESGWKINEAMPVNCAGFITARDHFVVDFDEVELLARVRDFANLGLSDAEVRAKYFAGFGSSKYPDGDSRGWKLPVARRRVAADTKWRDRVRTCLYRPFDIRSIYWSDWMVDWSRPEVMRHMFTEHAVALSTSRSVEVGRFEHVFCSRLPLGHHTVSLKEVNYMFPLHVLPDEKKHSLGFSLTREPNFAPGFLKALSVGLQAPQAGKHGLPGGLTAEDIFHFTYAVLHSPGYRARYAEFLKADFPHIPIPGSRELFWDLSSIGGVLVALHLVESPTLDSSVTTYFGPNNPEVVRVGWSDDTVWLDAAGAKKGQSASPGTIGFRSVPEAVWEFRIGGYQVCEKWLKDRKGRTLSQDDIEHYQKIVVAISETIRLMKEIDEVIEKHGGWPAAFQAGEPQAPPLVLTPQPAQGDLFARGAGEPVRPRLRLVEPGAQERYVTCVPLVPLKAAAGAFGGPQAADDADHPWVEITSTHRLRKGMFVAQVLGKSMEPTISDGAYCLFRSPVEGSRKGLTVLAQLRDAVDPETGERYTVKRYESVKSDGDEFRLNERITLRPANRQFAPIELEAGDEERLRVVAEFLEVVGEELLATDAAPVPIKPQPTIRPPVPNAPRDRPSHAQSEHHRERQDARKATAPAEAESTGDGIDPAALDRSELMCRIRRAFSDGRPRQRDEAIRELAVELGYERVSSKASDVLDSAIATAVRRGILDNEKGELKLLVTTIENYTRDFLKKQFLASLEGRAWTEREDAIRDLARWLGFRRTGATITDTARSIITGLLREGRLERQGEMIRRRL